MPGLKAIPIVRSVEVFTRPHVGQITRYSPAIRFPMIRKFIESVTGNQWSCRDHLRRPRRFEKQS